MLAAKVKTESLPVKAARPMNAKFQELRAKPLFQQLSPAALEVAKDIDVTDQIEALSIAKASLPDAKSRSLDPQVLSLRQDLTETLLMTFLEGRQVTAELDDQVAHANELRNVLEGKRDKAVRYNNILNFTSGGALAILASGLQIGTKVGLQNTGNEFEVMAGALQAGISAYALRLVKGERFAAQVHPNMLARVFDLPDPHDDHYPPAVWAYLDDPITPGGLSRRDLLIKSWVKVGRIQTPSPKNMDHIRLLCGTVAQKKGTSIDLLQDRAAMLVDLRAVVMEESKELLEIMRFIKKM